MLWLLCLGLGMLVFAAPDQPAAGTIDVSTLKIGAPASVAMLDLGKLKGNVEELSWAPDGTQFYLQMVESKGKVSHYLIAAEGGAITTTDARPAWANDYWKFKSDRYAPGIESLVIDVQQKYEKQGYGTGSAGAADRTSDGAGAGNINAPDNINKAAQSTTQSVVKLVLLNETIGTWVDKRPTPGTTFSWGPSGSGAIAFVDEKGHLVLLDNHQHKLIIPGTNEVAMPAWSFDGSRLAWLAKAGRNKYMLSWAAITRP
jgi:hypothetical protein